MRTRRPVGRGTGERRGGSPRGRSAAPVAAGAQQGDRVQKLLAQLGLASRREAEEWIRAGRISVNGAVAVLGTRVRPDDQLRLDGRTIRQHVVSDAKVYLCHRSPGEPLLPRAAREGEEPRQSVAERLPRNAGRRWISISPMPQIDGGLELLSGDGLLAARLQRALHGLRSEFSVRVRGELRDEQLDGARGGELDSGQRVAIEDIAAGGGEQSNRWYQLVAVGASGKDIRQLLERQGAVVSRIMRVRLGSLLLERSLPRGKVRALTDAELQALLAPAPDA